MLPLLLLTRLALATPPCETAAAEVDATFLAGEVDGAWTLAEEVAVRCGAGGLAERPLSVAGLWARTRQLLEAGRAAEGLPLAEREALVTLATSGPDSPSTAASLHNLATFHAALGQHDAALPLYERALSVYQRALPADHLLTAMVLADLAQVHEAARRYDRAEALSLQALEMRQRLVGPDDPVTAASLHDHAYLLNLLGRLTEARPLYERALASREQGLGPDHPLTLQTAGNLGGVLQRLGDFPAAVALAERVLASRQAGLGPDHVDTATAVDNLAELHMVMGDLPGARRLYERALATREAALGPDATEVATTLDGLGSCLQLQGELDGALALHQRSLAIRLAALGPDDPTTASSRNNLAGVLMARGDYAAALPLLEQALASLRATLGPAHPYVATTVQNLGSLHLLMGATEAARPLLEAALEQREAQLGPEHPDTSQARTSLAWLHLLAGDPAAALPLVQEGRRARQAALGPDHPDTAQALHNEATVLLALDRVAEAVPLLEAALAADDRTLGPDHPSAAQTAGRLAEAHRRLGRADLARPLVDRALPVALSTDDRRMRWHVLAGAADQAQVEDRPGEAVLWGKLAVQALEEVRAGVAQLDGGLEAGFVQQHQDTYRTLADRLVSQGRIPEAEGVLALLKADEQHRFQQRTGGGADEVVLTPAEAAWVARMGEQGSTVIADAREYRALRRASVRGELPEAQAARLAELSTRREAAQRSLDATLRELRADMGASGQAQALGALGLERAERTQARLPEGTVLVHAVLLPDHLLLLLTTPEARVAERVEVGAAEVHRAVATLRAALADPGADPRPAARQLHAWLLAPLETHLAQAGADTILAWLDGSLRYLPLAALHDGEAFVAERYATAVYTAASEADLLRAPVADPAVAAFGASQPAEVGGRSFGALPSVPGELDAVVDEGRGDRGAVPGRSHLDGAFTAAALADSLELGVPWVHIASHFQFTAGGTEADSFLVLGDGTALSVEALRLGDFPLAGVDLLALSACQTATGDSPRADGSEVEGLAVIAQDKGAGAVLATLWPVADASTAAWMASLYAGQVAEPLSRARAVQRVQRAFIGGEVGPDALPAVMRSQRLGPVEARAAPPGLEGWRHPYFWAPFVLYGVGG